MIFNLGLQPFREEIFHESTYTSQLLKSTSVSESLTLLSKKLSDVNQHLNYQVTSQHTHLLDQVTNLKELERILEVVKLGVDTLQISIHRITAEITEPASLLKSRTLQLSRLQSACDLLRKIIRFLYLARKLKSHLQAGSRELAKAAQCILELELIRKEADLTGIIVIDNETQWIIQAGEDVLTNASRMLNQGLETQNQAEVAAALQVFYNLGTLKSKVTTTMNNYINKITQTIQISLRTSNNEELINQETYKQAIWGKLDKLFDSLYLLCIQIWHLQRVLTKIRDPSTHICLIDQFITNGSPSFVQLFWKTMCTKLFDYFEQTNKTNPYFESCLVVDFPKLHKIIEEFIKRLQTHYEMKSIQTSTEDQTLLFNCINYYKAAYTSRLFSRFFDSINKIFINPTYVPSPEEVLNVISIIVYELEGIRTASIPLATLVSKNVAKAVLLFAAKSETQIAQDSSAFQINEPMNVGQLRNIKVFAILVQLQQSITNVINTMPLYIRNPVQQSFRDLEKQQEQIINPLFVKMTKQCEQIILGMHKEDFGNNDYSSMNQGPCSNYMKSLQNQISHFTTFIQRFSVSACLNSNNYRLSTRLLTFFVRHAALVRPLSETGKLKLAADMAQLELAIAPLQSVKELGSSYKSLRALRPFIFKETSQINDATSEVLYLLPSTVLHHLFSRAVLELQSPYQFKGWSIVKYSEWMDQNSEEQIWNLIKVSLDNYVNQVNSRGDKEFSPIYPVISTLGPLLIKMYNNKNKSK